MGHVVQPTEVTCILRRLDIDGDNCVSFDEFVEAISPVNQDPNSEQTKKPLELESSQVQSYRQDESQNQYQ